MLRTQVRTLPFSVGRRTGCDLALDSKMVSQQHAEIFEREGSLWLRDLGSTNGTFVNGERLTGDRRLGNGDILHFADLEFRLVGSGNDDGVMPVLTKTMNLQDVVPGIGRYRELRLLLQQNAVKIHFQPLIHLAHGTLLGYEALGRGALENAPTTPGELFAAAEAIGLATELSVAFRNKAIEAAAALPDPPRVFLNTHPSELQDQEALLASLEPLLASPPPFAVVLEIHESAVTDVVSLQGLRRELDRLHVGVAFDDFGTGQARLVELAEASPHYLKFDVRLIRDIHLMPKKQDIVRTLVRMVLDMGIMPIAEGVEREQEAAACRDLGFVYGQGYLFGRPLPAANHGEDTDTHPL
ncbi:MAG TPA: EAL domain-containing protein [Thermoanaerobaculia bacterium]